MEQASIKVEPSQHAYTLSPRQEELLFAALNSNKPATTNLPASSLTNTNPYAMAPPSMYESPVQPTPGSGTLDGFDESPFIDYGYELDVDNSFDYDFNADMQGQMIGKLPGTSSDGDGDGEGDIHDKRTHPDDEDEDEEGGGGGKRREGEEKTSKKPGRKPLTSEPTSKRKAQNRAAQRAFRERKEKHLKDLETKVEDLQKASESANHENAILRSQVEKMSVELREYKKRLSLTANTPRSASAGQALPSYLATQGLSNRIVNNPNEINFQFEFPRFGRLPGPPASNGATKSVSPQASASLNQGIPAVSPRSQYSPGSNSSGNQALTSFGNGDMSAFSGMFTNSPTVLDPSQKTSLSDMYAQSGANGSRSSTDSANGRNSTGHNTNYSSPTASSQSNTGASSSCGTSPEPSIQSPIVAKLPEATLTTIGEERPGDALSSTGELNFCETLNMACGNSKNPVPRTMSEAGVAAGILDTPSFDINGIDWFAEQNGNQFDPQLFGDYREPQENVLANDLYVDGYFADAFATPDFTSPFNIAPSPAAPKKDLMREIDGKLNEDEEVVPGEDRSKLLTCNSMWDRLQAKASGGDFDLDLLCKDLQKKAKCSETGVVVNEEDFDKIMQQYALKQ